MNKETPNKDEIKISDTQEEQLNQKAIKKEMFDANRPAFFITIAMAIAYVIYIFIH